MLLTIGIWAIRCFAYPLAILLALFGGRIAGRFTSIISKQMKEWNWHANEVAKSAHEKNCTFAGILFSVVLSIILSVNVPIEGDGKGIIPLLILASAGPLLLTVGLSGTLLGFVKFADWTWKFAGALNSAPQALRQQFEVGRSRRAQQALPLQSEADACVTPAAILAASPAATARTPVERIIEES